MVIIAILSVHEYTKKRRPDSTDVLLTGRGGRERANGRRSKNSAVGIPDPPQRQLPNQAEPSNNAGETFELRNGLVSQYAYERCVHPHTHIPIYSCIRTLLWTKLCRKEAIQKTIAAMTLGKDVSALFPDVLKNIATHDLGQKKLVYLYLMYVFTLASPH